MTRTLPVTEARQRLPALVSRMRRLLDRVIITRNGKPEAVMLSFDEFESWIETLELLSNPATANGIREGLKDLAAGRRRTADEVFGERPRGVRTKN